MTAPKGSDRQQPQKQQQQGSSSQLKERYGKIGISAVAGAVRHKPERKPAETKRYVPVDSD
ncbi:hypothetical protein ASD45_13610 [Pseudolabrys sp. Root1462]|uniref:hypothetical protein n=1 Tax=Pseudolabrys sp. Root1462 TaxID=1736466 RepID=UPI0007039541|nr:hypothetical protein [Pseudolabrys sp. Root1462]KQZ01774.1 hypothetical protein ASD45_13610 [Pseudolabrys sp. Root1462]